MYYFLLDLHVLPLFEYLLGLRFWGVRYGGAQKCRALEVVVLCSLEPAVQRAAAAATGDQNASWTRDVRMVGNLC